MKRILKITILILFSLLIYVPTMAASNTYYVSLSGSDSNPGTRSQPWVTIQYAVDHAPEGSQIIINPGSYHDTVIISQNNIHVIAQGRVITKGFFVTGNSNSVSGFELNSEDANNYGIRVEGNNNIFENNEIYNTHQDGIWFFGSGNVFRHNYIHDIIQRSSDPHIDCFQSWGPAENILFDGNICHNPNNYGSNQIVMLESINFPVREITFSNNIFIMEDSGYSALNVHRKSGQPKISGIHILNNTFYNITGSGLEAIRMLDISSSSIINNVSIGYDQITKISGGSVTVSNNIQSGNYGMVDYLNFNFHLTKNSPLIDTGINVAINNDYDNNFRPQGNGFDIGAFEFKPDASSMPPTATTVPSTSTTAPLTSTNMPSTSTTAPLTSTNVPLTSTTVPSTTITVPPTTATVPSTAIIVPQTTTTVPSIAIIVPQTTTTMSSTAITMSSTAKTIPSTGMTVPSTAMTVFSTIKTAMSLPVIGFILWCCVIGIFIMATMLLFKIFK